MLIKQMVNSWPAGRLKIQIAYQFCNPLFFNKYFTFQNSSRQIVGRKNVQLFDAIQHFLCVAPIVFNYFRLITICVKKNQFPLKNRNIEQIIRFSEQ